MIVKRLKVFYPKGKDFVSEEDLVSKFVSLVDSKISQNLQNGMVFSGIQFLPYNFVKINVFEREFTQEDYPNVAEDSFQQTLAFRESLSERGYRVVFDTFSTSLDAALGLGDFIEIKEVNGISNTLEILRSQR